jgi:DNA-binding IclR family transcriptional regulator
MRISHQGKRVLQAFLDSPADETYGFALSRATGLQPGTLYPLLERMLEEGWLTTRMSGSSWNFGGDPHGLVVKR